MEPADPSLSLEDVQLVREKVAVAFRLHANARASKVAFWILVIGASLAFWFSNYWLLALGMTASFAAFFLIRESCVRHIEHKMGIPPIVQDVLAARYKTDGEFKQAVDRLYQGASKFVDELARKRANARANAEADERSAAAAKQSSDVGVHPGKTAHRCPHCGHSAQPSDSHLLRCEYCGKTWFRDS